MKRTLMIALAGWILAAAGCTTVPETKEAKAVQSAEVTEAIAEPLANIVGVVRSVLGKTPPELAADIIDRGMMLTGGSSLLRNMDKLLTKETGVPSFVAENPMACVAIGAGRALENYNILRRMLMPATS